MVKANHDECQRIKELIVQANKYIDMLYKAPCAYSKDSLLFKMESIMDEIEQACSRIREEADDSKDLRQRELTLEELSKYTGKNGNPAYVAVNNVVYDVTNVPAWAAATHFGLTAGKDQTGAFTSCHVGQSILDKLTVVGKLI